MVQQNLQDDRKNPLVDFAQDGGIFLFRYLAGGRPVAQDFQRSVTELDWVWGRRRNYPRTESLLIMFVFHLVNTERCGWGGTRRGPVGVLGTFRHTSK